MTITTVRPGTPDDIRTLGWLLAQAFRADPVTTWLVPDPAAYTPAMHGFFEILTEDALKDGTVDVLIDDTGTTLAAALWFDRATPDELASEESVPDTRLDAVFGTHADRWHALDRLMTQRHPAMPHQYLMVIGVRPARQHHGFGSRLLEAAHKRIGGQATYLEATTLQSRRLYMRHGYTLLGDPLKLPDGPCLWPMWREAE